MLSISSTIKRNVSRSYVSIFKKSQNKFEKIIKEILGKNYDLSLVFIGDKRSQTLNRNHRGKNYPANVLSFSLEKDSGEIFINLDSIKKGAIEFEMSENKYIAYLFIHGCLHLKGYDHGKSMDRLEHKYIKNI